MEVYGRSPMRKESAREASPTVRSPSGPLPGPTSPQLVQKRVVVVVDDVVTVVVVVVVVVEVVGPVVGGAEQTFIRTEASIERLETIFL